MRASEVLQSLREKQGLSQEELAKKVSVLREAVSCWESGAIIPDPETLKKLSQLFGVSVNALLGLSQSFCCQCCGMPLDEKTMSQEADGSLNKEYCKWCYHDGVFVYRSQEELMNFLTQHMADDPWQAMHLRAYFKKKLSRLKHWKEPDKT